MLQKLIQKNTKETKNNFGSSTRQQGLGSASVSLAVFGVPPNTFLPPFDPRERIREEVGRGTHPTASENPEQHIAGPLSGLFALPGPDPLKTSRKHIFPV
jgi:large exoprotein involved in heme utilization and adhesion